MNLLCVVCLRDLYHPGSYVRVCYDGITWVPIRHYYPDEETIHKLNEAVGVEINNQRVGFTAVTMLRGNLVCHAHVIPLVRGLVVELWDRDGRN